MIERGLIQHEFMFFTNDGTAIPDVKYPYDRWERTLKRLPIRYRRPYVARHTSVSWNLMIGRNPLLIAKEHGHRVLTMLTVYAAWTEGAAEADTQAIQYAMDRTELSGIRHYPIIRPAASAVTGTVAQLPARRNLAMEKPRDTRPKWEDSDCRIISARGIQQ